MTTFNAAEYAYYAYGNDSNLSFAYGKSCLISPPGRTNYRATLAATDCTNYPLITDFTLYTPTAVLFKSVYLTYDPSNHKLYAVIRQSAVYALESEISFWTSTLEKIAFTMIAFTFEPGLHIVSTGGAIASRERQTNE